MTIFTVKNGNKYILIENLLLYNEGHTSFNETLYINCFYLSKR